MIAACNADDAATIFENMQPTGDTTADFAAVKKAFENNYACLGITCADVGGAYDSETSSYFTGADPCVDSAGVPSAPIAGSKPSPPSPSGSSPMAAPTSSGSVSLAVGALMLGTISSIAF